MWELPQSDDQLANDNAMPAASYVPIAEAVLAALMKLGRVLGSDAAAYPALNMLMYLYIRQKEGRPTSLSSTWLASGVAYSTARRYLNSIEERGIVLRSSDPADGRRWLVRLAPAALQLIETCLEPVRKTTIHS